MMSIERPNPEPTHGWQCTIPGELSSEPPPSRVQPPLKEVLKGLDVRELEGETVFDQLFGQPPQPNPPRR